MSFIISSPILYFTVMKLVAFAALVGSAAAFAFAPAAKTTSALNAFESELGAQR